MNRTLTAGATRGRRLSLIVAALTLALVAAMFASDAAWAAQKPRAAGDCPGRSLAQVFLPWGDEGWYTPLPDGGFELGAQGWTLEGGARVVAGNEPFRVGGGDDSRSLLLPAGSAAVSPPLCVGRDHDTLRGFARHVGPRSSQLVVKVIWQPQPGRTRTLPIGNLHADSAWLPTRIMKLAVNALGLRPGETTEVSFSFAPRGGGEWWIDDFYVDPFRRS